MLYEVLIHLRNLFPSGKCFSGIFNIRGGKIELPLLEGQYFLIEGSVMNNGLYQYPAEDLVDEEFRGTITALAVPSAVVALANEIEAYTAKYHDKIYSPFSSESFGGYSYSKAGGDSGMARWQDVFKERLDAWRKI